MKIYKIWIHIFYCEVIKYGYVSWIHYTCISEEQEIDALVCLAANVIHFIFLYYFIYIWICIFICFLYLLFHQLISGSF